MSARAVEASFVLNVYEIEAALRLAGKIPRMGNKNVIQACLLGVGGVLFVYYSMLEPENRVYKTIALLCAALAVFVLVLPRQRGKRLAKAAHTGRQVAVLAGEESLRVSPEGREPWDVPLDGSLKTAEDETLFLIHLPNGQLLILPKRAFEKEDIAALRQRLFRTPQTP